MTNEYEETLSIITVRVVRNFEYRTVKNCILKFDLKHDTVADLKRRIEKEIQTQPGFLPYRTVKYDTLKIYSHAFGNKSQNLVINMDRDGFLDNLDLTLEQAGLKPESEVSFFNIDAYNKFVVDPQIKW
ncbi:UPF0538 protein [Smittium culicis]|uniref:UPF0538 protein n=1 Tax=Smittium culicis TaxID=133412 RepID=A0A1R1XBC8_9FUNG|nr:UPF0538 protein [Smittium culicis]OMJ24422.1 UPF0538 protein [Smittium culicis]